MQKTARVALFVVIGSVLACSRANDQNSAPAAPAVAPATASAAPVPTQTPQQGSLDRPNVPTTATQPAPPPVDPGRLAPSKMRPGAGMSGGSGGAFDGTAAARALASVDLTGCGAPAGTSGRVNVTFSPDGSAKSEIDATGLSTAAAACIRGRYDAVRVPAFDGAPAKTAKSFLIP